MEGIAVYGFLNSKKWWKYWTLSITAFSSDFVQIFLEDRQLRSLPSKVQKRAPILHSSSYLMVPEWYIIPQPSWGFSHMGRNKVLVTLYKDPLESIRCPLWILFSGLLSCLLSPRPEEDKNSVLSPWERSLAFHRDAGDEGGVGSQYQCEFPVS